MIQIMKNLSKAYILFALIALIFTSCDKEDTEGLSRITNFPTFEMNGNKYMSIVKGEQYTEAGVTATEGGSDIEVTISGTVDVNTPGVYDITYSAVNKDGFSGQVTRTVAVLPTAEQAGVDISGKYSNIGSFNYVSEVTKLAPGFYVSKNVWGGNSKAIIAAYIFTTDGSNLTLPLSALSGYGRLEGTGTLSETGTMNLTVTLLDQGPFTAAKQWQKQ